jgi:hypothetical protein
MRFDFPVLTVAPPAPATARVAPRRGAEPGARRALPSDTRPGERPGRDDDRGEA